MVDPHPPCARSKHWHCGVCFGVCRICRRPRQFNPGTAGLPWFSCCEIIWTRAHPIKPGGTPDYAVMLSSERHLSDDLAAAKRKPKVGS